MTSFLLAQSPTAEVNTYDKIIFRYEIVQYVGQFLLVQSTMQTYLFLHFSGS